MLTVGLVSRITPSHISETRAASMFTVLRRQKKLILHEVRKQKPIHMLTYTGILKERRRERKDVNRE